MKQDYERPLPSSPAWAEGRSGKGEQPPSPAALATEQEVGDSPTEEVTRLYLSIAMVAL